MAKGVTCLIGVVLGMRRTGTLAVVNGMRDAESEFKPCHIG